MEIHPSFKLNGKSFYQEELTEIAYSLIKEGEEHEVVIGDFLLDWLNDSDEVIVKTSGSTGQPKPVSLHKTHMVNSAFATGDFFNLKAGDSALLCLSSGFIAGKMMLVRAMVLGLELDITEPSSNPLTENKKTYDFCAMVPMQVENSIEKLHQIKTLIIGGAPVSNLLKDKLQNISANCFETYGMTETITHVAARPLNYDTSEENYFEVLPNVSISLDDRHCMVINAPKISNETITTNDLVKLIDNNRFKWLGRHDNIINSGGVKLIPEQIEDKLSGLLENRFFVTGIPDETLGQKLVLVVEGRKNEFEIIKSINSSKVLSRYEIPRKVFVVPEFIETLTGKINRNKIRERFISI